MEVLKQILKVTWQFFVFTLVNFVWKPIKWLFSAWKSSRKPKFETKSAMSDVQAMAAKSLPELTKRKAELEAEQKKLSDKWNVANTERLTVEALIKAAGGDLGQNNKPQNNRNNNQNNQKQKQNNNQQNNGNKPPSIADADFAK
ncbi:hypothetical protein VP5_027 [Vibrio virus VPMCC5]|uniref:hypothetical protein n=1 Tax=Salmonella enterica TaxID=28901 RepID=UPI00288F50D4|nr:hypothetical protein [Salmonella enterica]MDT1790505.1 hypothetical protein [Salmonella enterica subsp. enterica serovar Oslo]UIW11039.1 hypothetical protein VP5_027 [Vibrio virus VPMCC5]